MMHGTMNLKNKEERKRFERRKERQKKVKTKVENIISRSWPLVLSAQRVQNELHVCPKAKFKGTFKILSTHRNSYLEAASGSAASILSRSEVSAM
jgi:hypothetical protein